MCCPTCWHQVVCFRTKRCLPLSRLVLDTGKNAVQDGFSFATDKFRLANRGIIICSSAIKDIKPCFSFSRGIAVFTTGMFFLWLPRASWPRIRGHWHHAWTWNCRGKDLAGPLFCVCTSKRKLINNVLLSSPAGVVMLRNELGRILKSSVASLTGLCWIFSLPARRLILSLASIILLLFQRLDILIFSVLRHCCLGDVQKRNRPQVSMVYKLKNHLGCW